MTSNHHLSAPPIVENAVYAERSEQLSDIHLPHKNIAILRRQVDHLENEIRQVLEQWPEGEFRASGTTEAIIAELDAWEQSLPQTATALKEDIASMVRHFSVLTGSESLRLFLGRINSNMCRRFHTDINTLRLLCTYSGPGTLWLPNDNIDHQAMTRKGTDPGIAIDENKIQQVDAGEIVILKGAVYPGENTQACVHRSPTIEESGETRLLLRLDTNGFLSDLN
ncbi:MAG: DUF1826 domain-containing protein [Bacteroidota bacterium]